MKEKKKTKKKNSVLVRYCSGKMRNYCTLKNLTCSYQPQGGGQRQHGWNIGMIKFLFNLTCEHSHIQLSRGAEGLEPCIGACIRERVNLRAEMNGGFGSEFHEAACTYHSMYPVCLKFIGNMRQHILNRKPLALAQF